MIAAPKWSVSASLPAARSATTNYSMHPNTSGIGAHFFAF